MRIEAGGVGILSVAKRRGEAPQFGRLAPFVFGGQMGAKTKATAKKVKEASGAVAEPEHKALPPLRPSQCRAYMRRELAREFRGIVEGFVDGAKKGSCQHVKLATELVGTPERQQRRGKSVVRKLIEEMEGRQG